MGRNFIHTGKGKKRDYVLNITLNTEGNSLNFSSCIYIKCWKNFSCIRLCCIIVTFFCYTYGFY